MPINQPSLSQPASRPCHVSPTTVGAPLRDAGSAVARCLWRVLNRFTSAVEPSVDPEISSLAFRVFVREIRYQGKDAFGLCAADVLRISSTNRDGFAELGGSIRLMREKLLEAAGRMEKVEHVHAFVNDVLGGKWTDARRDEFPPKWQAKALDVACRGVCSSRMDREDFEVALGIICEAASHLPDAVKSPLLRDCAFVLQHGPGFIQEEDRNCGLQRALASCVVKCVSERDKRTVQRWSAELLTRQMEPDFWTRLQGLVERDGHGPALARMLPKEVKSLLEMREFDFRVFYHGARAGGARSSPYEVFSTATVCVDVYESSSLADLMLAA